MAQSPLTDYEKYIRTTELLALQKPAGELSTHDEMQFQIVHQVAELWMKLIDHELARAARLIDENHVGPAIATLHRVNAVQTLLLHQLDLLDTMAPKDYMTIRTVLGHGSGQESPGFRKLVRIAGENLEPALQRLLRRRSVTLREVYEEHDRHDEMYRLCEALLNFDQQLQIWRQRHLLLVYRIIGAGTPSLKGKHSELLEKGMKQRFLPELWDVRDEVFAEWTRQQTASGKTTGYDK
jgi:tryptophan 2,3-dioxygenase